MSCGNGVPGVRVDARTCIGSGNCLFYAPGTFELDKKGIALVIDAAGDPVEAVLEAAESCPTQAISIEDA